MPSSHLCNALQALRVLLSDLRAQSTSSGGIETWSSGRMGTSKYSRPFLCRASTRSISASFSLSPPGMAARVHSASSFSVRFLYSTSPVGIHCQCIRRCWHSTSPLRCQLPASHLTSMHSRVRPLPLVGFRCVRYWGRDPQAHRPRSGSPACQHS